MTELPYLTAFLLGGLHALEADHMTAVTAFAVRKPEPRAAVRFGLQWAAGHGTAILLIGMLLIFIGMSIPETATGLMEQTVGFVLIGLGVWTVIAMRRAHQRAHAHAPTLVGLLHGFAGSAAAVALVPLALMDSAFNGVAYLVCFAVGTALSMSAYALCAGYLAGRAHRIADSFGRSVGVFTGVGTIAVGIVWLLR